MITKHNEDWTKIFPEYQELRKPDGDAIADMAIANFVEMRDKTGDPKFLLQKKIEASFSSKHPDKWVPFYSKVVFSPDVRYSTAMKDGQAQDAIMQKIMAMPDIENKWDSAEVENAILGYLK